MTVEQVGALCAFLSSCTWAVGSTVYSRLSRNHTAFAVNLARSLFALPLFIIGAFIFAGSFGGGISAFRALGTSSALWFLLSTFASYGLGDAVFLISTQSLGVPGALAIASCYPIWTAGAGWLFQGQGLSALQAEGLFLTVGGIIAVILYAPHAVPSGAPEAVPYGGGSEGTGEILSPRARSKIFRSRTLFPVRGPVRGVALAILASLFWALNGYAVFRGGQGLSMPVANAVRMAIAILLSPLVGRLLAPGEPMLLPIDVIRRSLWIFIVEACCGSALFVYGLCHSALAIGATLSALAPVISVPVALLLGLERFSLGRTLGVLVAVVGLKLLVG